MYKSFNENKYSNINPRISKKNRAENFLLGSSSSNLKLESQNISSFSCAVAAATFYLKNINPNFKFRDFNNLPTQNINKDKFRTYLFRREQWRRDGGHR